MIQFVLKLGLKRVATIGGLFLVAFGTTAAKAEPTPPVITTVFENDFNSDFDPANWTTVERRDDDDGNGYLVMRTWLLQFSHKNLPEHQYAKARIRMMMFGSVEGAPAAGPTDFWTVSLANGPTLFRSAFQMRGKDQRGVLDGVGQAFPDEAPAGLHPAETGQVKLGKLARNVPIATYEFELTFPHEGDELALDFQNTFTDGKNEGWYMDGFEIDLISAATPRTDEEFAKLWKKLIGDDPMAAMGAVNEFILSGGPGVEYVKKQWGLIQAAIADGSWESGRQKAMLAEIKKQLTLLGSNDFVERITAQTALKELGSGAIPHLEKKLKGARQPALKSALKKALTSLRKKAKGPVDAKYQEGLIASRVSRVMRVSGETTRGLKVSASETRYQGALTDGFLGEKGNGNEAPRFVWWGSGGGKEGWLRYDYDKARTFDSAEAFWFKSRTSPKTGSDLPQSWSLSYLDGDDWKPITPKGAYDIAEGEFVRVEFDPITTKAIRLDAKSKLEAGRMGLLEFRMGESKP